MAENRAIAETEIKRLWGKSAGHCNNPACGQDCLPFLVPGQPTIVGEMAHIIAHSQRGARGSTARQSDNTYENLILLCPMCHTKVDKAPDGAYTVDMLIHWKQQHEAKVAAAMSVPQFITAQQLAQEISKLLTENHAIWDQWGPESNLAKRNPFGTGQQLWDFHKLSKIIPNNSRIAKLVMSHRTLISTKDWPKCAKFQIHASAFEQNTYERLDSDSVPRFPSEFSELIDRLAVASL